MDTAAFDREIARAQAQASAITERAEVAAQAIIDAIGKIASAWACEYVESEVTQKHEVTRALGVERLSGMKEELKSLAESLPAVAAKEFEKNSYWSHRAKNRRIIHSYLSTYRMHPGNGLPAPLRDGAEVLRGNIGSFLVKYGFLENKDRASSMPMPEVLTDIVNAYADLDEELARREFELSAAKEKKAKAEAHDLWEKA